MPFNICQALSLAVVAFSTLTLQSPVAAEDATDQNSAAFKAAAAQAQPVFDAAYEALENNAANKADLVMAAQAAAIRLYSGGANTVDYLDHQLQKTDESVKAFYAAHPPPQPPQRRSAKRRNVERDVAKADAVDTSQAECKGFFSFLGSDVCEAIGDKVTDAIKDYDPTAKKDDDDSTKDTKDQYPPGYPFFRPGSNYPFGGYPYGGYPYGGYPYGGYPYGGYPYGGSPYGPPAIPSDGPGKTSCDDIPNGYICSDTFDTLSYCASATYYSPAAEYTLATCGHFFCCVADNKGQSGTCVC